MKIFLILTYIFCLNLFSLENFSNYDVKKMQNKYGKKTFRRMQIWDKTLQKAKRSKQLNKLKLINDFFNKIRYKTDIKHWKVRDYWASPYEFIGTLAGDCEDYAIAKYFALKKVGISTQKLRIAYVKLSRKRTKYDESHMVLLYFHKPNSIPIVLDNVNKRLKIATKRRDLKLIYSFNGLGLWKSKNKGKNHRRVGSNKLKKWKNLLNKI